MLFFRYKTVTVNLRLFLIQIKLDGKISGVNLYDEYYKLYEIYNIICSQVEKYNQIEKVELIVHCKIHIENDPQQNKIFFSNIFFKKDLINTPFLMSFVHDN